MLLVINVEKNSKALCSKVLIKFKIQFIIFSLSLSLKICYIQINTLLKRSLGFKSYFMDLWYLK